jgi:hypothetical protein
MPVRWLSVAGAVVGAALVWVIAVPVAGVDLVATPLGGSTMHVTLLAVLVSSLVAGLAGLGLLRLLERRSPKGLRNWTGTAAVVLVLSLASPMGGETLGAKLSLVAMHLVVGAVLITGFRAGVTRPSRVAVAAR